MMKVLAVRHHLSAGSLLETGDGSVVLLACSSCVCIPALGTATLAAVAHLLKQQCV